MSESLLTRSCRKVDRSTPESTVVNGGRRRRIRQASAGFWSSWLPEHRGGGRFPKLVPRPPGSTPTFQKYRFPAKLRRCPSRRNLATIIYRLVVLFTRNLTQQESRRSEFGRRSYGSPNFRRQKAPLWISSKFAFDFRRATASLRSDDGSSVFPATCTTILRRRLTPTLTVVVGTCAQRWLSKVTEMDF